MSFFRSVHPDQKIGFSKFAELRPEECILVGPSGTHTVCVCREHENVKLMVNAGMLNKIQMGGVYLLTYKHCIAQLCCNPPSISCIRRTCEACPKASVFADKLTDAYEEMHVDKVEYRKWSKQDRSELETVTQSPNEFAIRLGERLEELIEHDFIARSQNAYLENLKTTLKPREAIVMVDFAENYSVITQNEIQSHHWNKRQATVHPFVAHWREGENLEHTTYAAISDCLDHDTVAFSIFQEKFLAYLQEKMGHRPEKIFYFSDGCASQYKGCKNFLNLTYHYEDYKIRAEWHFFATSHGKGPCDGVGGTLKRLAARASLQGRLIETPHAFYDYLKAHTTTFVEYFPKSDWDSKSHRFKLRFLRAKTAVGTRQQHAVLPISVGHVLMRCYSSSDTGQERKVMR